MHAFILRLPLSKVHTQAILAATHQIAEHRRARISTYISTSSGLVRIHTSSGLVRNSITRFVIQSTITKVCH